MPFDIKVKPTNTYTHTTSVCLSLSLNTKKNIQTPTYIHTNIYSRKVQELGRCHTNRVLVTGADYLFRSDFSNDELACYLHRIDRYTIPPWCVFHARSCARVTALAGKQKEVCRDEAGVVANRASKWVNTISVPLGGGILGYRYSTYVCTYRCFAAVAAVNDPFNVRADSEAADESQLP